MPAATLTNRKLDHAFRQLDTGGDGWLDREDLVNLGARILIGFGEAPTTRRGRDLLDHLDTFFDALVAEADGERAERVSAAEFHAGMTRVFIVGDGFDRALRPALTAVARVCDSDNSGRLGLAEFSTLQSAFGTEPAAVATAFGRLDTDGSGDLSVGELVEAAREFYVGTDAEAGGNWLFGEL